MRRVTGSGTNPGRAAGYVCAGLLAGAAVTAAGVAAFGGNRVVTALLAGAIAGVALMAVLFASDVLVLGSDGLQLRTAWRRRTVPWQRVRGARFEVGPQWTLTVDTEDGPLVLLSMPPVRDEISQPYDYTRRATVRELLAGLREASVPMTVDPAVERALRRYWRLTSGDG